MVSLDIQWANTVYHIELSHITGTKTLVIIWWNPFRNIFCCMSPYSLCGNQSVKHIYMYAVVYFPLELLKTVCQFLIVMHNCVFAHDCILSKKLKSAG
uniref:Uncharacterized protein n=1 Tax=Anguilla anguilla TaxID=7936 RepID=A0A0E9XJ06_ANGAN